MIHRREMLEHPVISEMERFGEIGWKRRKGFSLRRSCRHRKVVTDEVGEVFTSSAPCGGTFPSRGRL